MLPSSKFSAAYQSAVADAPRTHFLAIRVGHTVVEPIRELTAGRRAVWIDGAAYSRLAQRTDQRNASAVTSFGAFHAGDDIIDLARHFKRDLTAGCRALPVHAIGEVAPGRSGPLARRSWCSPGAHPDQPR